MMLGESVETSEIDDDDDADLGFGKLKRTSSKYPCFPTYSAYNGLSSHLPPKHMPIHILARHSGISLKSQLLRG